MSNDFYISVHSKNDIESRKDEKIVIHNGIWHFARFSNFKQFRKFAKLLGFKYKLLDRKKYYWFSCGQEKNKNVLFLQMSHEIKEMGYFWNLPELPEGCQHIKALSNGSMVDCYFKNVGDYIEFYRPNPNAKNVYKPLSLEDRIIFIRENGYC